MIMENYQMPVGLGMALAQRPEAMEKFATLSETKKTGNYQWYTFSIIKRRNATVCG